MTDPKRLETLFRQHYGQMYRLAVMLLHDAEEAKDVVHDVFTALLDRQQPLHDDTVQRYLLTSVRNRCLNVMRNRKVQERISRRYLLDLETSVVPTAHLLDEARVLRQGIDGLQPPVCREVVVGHFSEGRTFREIAARMGVSETTVYKYLRQALGQLRALLNQ